MDDAPTPAGGGFDPAADGWSHEPEPGFVGLVGPIWYKGEGARRRFGFLAEPRHVNLIGVVQGGMMMTFADRALGMLAWEAAGRPCATISFDCQFAGGGRIGTFIEMGGEVVRRTSGLVFMRGLVASGAAPLLSCAGTWRILSERRRSPEPSARA